LLGAEKWIGGLQFVSSIDCFDAPDAVATVRPGGKALFLMLDEQSEVRAQSMGLQICLPDAALRKHLDSKVVTTELANRAGIASVPNVLAKIASYGELRDAASALGQDLVVQLPYGDSGKTTFFISDEEDFRRHADAIAAQRVVKIMRRIRCRQLTIEGCVTRRCTLVGPLQTEMVGLSELTPYAGGWCGNEVFAAGDSTLLTADLRERAQQATFAMGEQLRRLGYRGCFGLDLLLDQDSGALYLGEMNPRITGATSLTSQAMLDGESVPLLLFHLLEWFGVDCEIDDAAFNRQWLRAEHVSSWSHMILYHTDRTSSVSHVVPPSGLWRMQADGSVRFCRRAFSADAVNDESEAFFLRTVNPGQRQDQGANLGRIVMRGRLLTDEYQLTARAQAWIHGFKAVSSRMVSRHGQSSAFPQELLNPPTLVRVAPGLP
jgi:hypothetical protein